ncbi:MAG: alkaline phosphatase family protein [Clostridia bacterium]|nr:alkaline phosphatase family protein [Clostridia bacterium]
MLNIFYSVIAAIASFFMMMYGVIGGLNNFDTIQKYEENVAAFEPYENTIETAVPQTEIYNVIKEHFESELPAGKLVKKAIVIGYDGCRADALTLCENDGAVAKLITTGGKAYVAYCGGVNYPVFNTQDTSTAPGWASILTGKWADAHGITGNGIVKSTEHLTLLTSLVEEKTIDDSAFYVSWNGHFVGDDSTYKLEKAYCEEKGLDVTFSDADDDEGTVNNTLKDIKSLDCSDFIFTILEHTDHAGHGTGFDLDNPDYSSEFALAEAEGAEMIDAIESRLTYPVEDWLIIITSDHGGFNTGHGGFTIQERMTFYVVR